MFYKRAETFADRIPACNLTKLALTLNVAIFHVEIMHDRSTAIDIVEASLRSALDQVMAVNNKTLLQVKSTIATLRSCLAKWQEEANRDMDRLNKMTESSVNNSRGPSSPNSITTSGVNTSGAAGGGPPNTNLSHGRASGNASLYNRLKNKMQKDFNQYD